MYANIGTKSAAICDREATKYCKKHQLTELKIMESNHLEISPVPTVIADRVWLAPTSPYEVA
jgi:hypothetical protein